MIKAGLIICAAILSFNSCCQETNLKIKFEFLDTTSTIQVDVLKFYISDVTLVSNSEIGQINYRNSWLVDFSSMESQVIELNNSPESFHSIEFTLGTDSLTNVSGAFDGALDPIHGMYWAWNSGYINTKIEGVLKIEDRDAAPFEYHLGGYAGEFKTARKLAFELSSINKSEIVIAIDLNYFMDFIDVSKTNRVMSPGKKASLLSTLFSESLKIIE